jgi:hypothetical protein
MMVRVHEPGQDDFAAGPGAGPPVRPEASRSHGRDTIVLDQDPSAGQTPAGIVHGGGETGIVDEDAHSFFIRC